MAGLYLLYIIEHWNKYRTLFWMLIEQFVFPALCFLKLIKEVSTGEAMLHCVAGNQTGFLAVHLPAQLRQQFGRFAGRRVRHQELVVELHRQAHALRTCPSRY